jgi:hypothetical protein
MARVYKRPEVEELLAALQRSAEDVISHARRAADEVGKDSYEGYTRFREKAEDFETLAILIEYRLKNMGTARIEDLETKFTELNAYMLGATLTTSLHFLNLLSGQTHLPLGSRDMFLRELKSLHNAKEKLQGPKYAEQLNERTARDIKVAEEILSVIIDRAPNLLQLGVS